MSWILAHLLGWVPWLWALPALAAAGLWLYALLVPNRVAAEAARVLVIVLAGVAIYLFVFADAERAARDVIEDEIATRVAAMRQADEDALTAARTAARDAETELGAMRARLDDVTARVREMPPPAGCRIGIRKFAADGLQKLRPPN